MQLLKRKISSSCPPKRCSALIHQCAAPRSFNKRDYSQLVGADYFERKGLVSIRNHGNLHVGLRSPKEWDINPINGETIRHFTPIRGQKRQICRVPECMGLVEITR